MNVHQKTQDILDRLDELYGDLDSADKRGDVAVPDLTKALLETMRLLAEVVVVNGPFSVCQGRSALDIHHRVVR